MSKRGLNIIQVPKIIILKVHILGCVIFFFFDKNSGNYIKRKTKYTITPHKFQTSGQFVGRTTCFITLTKKKPTNYDCK